MTRINLVHPSTLHTKHLVAEYRELPRIFGLVAYAQACGQTPASLIRANKLPPAYVLGKGHCTFFYDKLLWLSDRFSALVAECQARGFNIQYTTPNSPPNLQKHWHNDYVPTAAAIAINLARIQSRMPK